MIKWNPLLRRVELWSLVDIPLYKELGVAYNDLYWYRQANGLRTLSQAIQVKDTITKGTYRRMRKHPAKTDHDVQRLDSSSRKHNLRQSPEAIPDQGRTTKYPPCRTWGIRSQTVAPAKTAAYRAYFRSHMWISRTYRMRPPRAQVLSPWKQHRWTRKLSHWNQKGTTSDGLIIRSPQIRGSIWINSYVYGRHSWLQTVS